MAHEVYKSTVEALKKALEDKKELEQVSRKKVETTEKEGKMYLEAFVGPDTSADRMDAFIYSAWDPTNHAGVVMKSWGRNIRIAKAITDELIEKSRMGETVFNYKRRIVSPRRLGLGMLLNAPLFIAYSDRVEPSPIRPPPIT